MTLDLFWILNWHQVLEGVLPALLCHRLNGTLINRRGKIWRWLSGCSTHFRKQPPPCASCISPWGPCRINCCLFWARRLCIYRLHQRNHALNFMKFLFNVFFLFPFCPFLPYSYFPPRIPPIHTHPLTHTRSELSHQTHKKDSDLSCFQCNFLPAQEHLEDLVSSLTVFSPCARSRKLFVLGKRKKKRG